MAAISLALVALAGANANAQETQNPISVRDHLIHQQESLLNFYRCHFNIDAPVVPGGCSNGQPAPADTSPQQTSQSQEGQTAEDPQAGQSQDSAEKEAQDVIDERPTGDNVVTISPAGDSITIETTTTDGDSESQTHEAPAWAESHEDVDKINEWANAVQEAAENGNEPADDGATVVINNPTSDTSDEGHAENWENWHRAYENQKESGEPFMVCDPARTVETTWVDPDTGESKAITIEIEELCWWENR
ncbi:hypothetical protein [Candidatus Poriferisocius sp.]|uniref:hypothetical protein n=1 Tax=Candidatus Poriferisocius sp. TaxID=3101276 RepID=UPI003B0270C4